MCCGVGGVVPEIGAFSRYWVHIPMVAPALGPDLPDGPASPDSPASTAADPWEWWAALRQLCVPTARLCVALELTADLPSV